MPTSVCPKCSGRFEDGFILERGRHDQGQTMWVEGKAERSFWQGVKIRGRLQHAITTHRCTRCGYLESYAPSA
jgi:predicted nucleic-acid-binding Zn-ribbon protein